jgi:tRNA threonylcarbamoyladenosine biosynthesis protein TsaB
VILAIETATASLGVALADGEHILAAMQFHRGNAHDELLVPLCRDIVDHAGLTMQDLRAIGVSAGPGSFTGLRIGMAAAKGMALGLNLPLAVVPTLDAAAEGVARRWRHAGAMLAVCIDARREHVYAAVYQLDGHGWTIAREARLCESAALVAQLPEDCMLAGDGAAKVHALAPRTSHLLPDSASVFDARWVALLGARMIAAGDSADIDTCEPMYLQEFHVRSTGNSPH